jgi:type VI secretion system VasD/TssJ family lipoprotein
MLERFPLPGRFALVAWGLLQASCGGGGFLGIGGDDGPPKLCHELRAAKDLNLFDGQPHVVVVHFYPLQNATAFEATNARDLIRGAKPAGVAGEPWQTTVLPGQTLRLGEQLPRDTADLGIVADYYRGPSRIVVSASCDSDDEERVITLAASSIEKPKSDEESDEESE